MTFQPLPEETIILTEAEERLLWELIAHRLPADGTPDLEREVLRIAPQVAAVFRGLQGEGLIKPITPQGSRRPRSVLRIRTEFRP